MTDLHVDIETYSSVNIKDCGAYKYIESPDFEILLIAFAFNDEPVEIVDVAAGEKPPERFVNAMIDPKVRKWAHNAVFERLAFNRIGFKIPISEWYCSMIKAAYCGLPLALGQVSKALKLEDKSKMAIGKRLIKYFCVPCKPTKANGERTRNLFSDNAEKWGLFKKYCMQDVEAEREICNRLKKYNIPQWERENYVLDQEINDRGVLIDLQLAESATKIDDTNKAILRGEMIQLTGLDNPNSQTQMRQWVSARLKRNVPSLNKEFIPELLEEAKGTKVETVLNMRSQLSKSSTKKYVSMQNCYCLDGRAHGLLQFYGANRTGRWAGRLVQLQNLPQNHLKDLDTDRRIILEGDYDFANMCYGDTIPFVLSQLIRTAFIAPEGKTFAVADFSAIEARVIAWLSGEQWRLDVFRTHGKIYEASASMMFGVPIEDIKKGSDYRAKGKIAELALGFGGSVGALEKMGGAKMGLSKGEMQTIVDQWRGKSSKITALWKKLEKGAKTAIRTRRKIEYPELRGLAFECDGDCLIITLPSKRQLFYREPGFCVNRFGSESIRYRGMDQVSKQWTYLETYGGKLSENIVQAIARDLLMYSMRSLDEKGYPIVMHVHDEAICEVDVETSAESLIEMCDIMGEGPEWSEGLPLNADGYITPYYKKD